MSTDINAISKQLTHSIENGIDYLAEHQLPNGEFCCYYAPDDPMKEWCVPDSVVFTTAMIAASILQLRESPKVKNILSSAASFLSYQMSRGGVWNYFTKWNPIFSYSPSDVDTTVYTSYVLKSLNVDFPDNTVALLANRNSKGLFYTWYVLRPKWFFPKDFLIVVLRELKRPLKSLVFWLKHEGGRNDIDAAVNANVLFYLGLNEHTRPIVKYLVEIILLKKEAVGDKWYKNPIIMYYLISRNYQHTKELDAARDQVIERVFTFYHENGSFGNSVMETALAISILLNFNHTDERLGKAVDFLIENQRKSGSWDRHILFYSGPSKKVGWGCEELATSFCLEALNSYKLKMSL